MWVSGENAFQAEGAGNTKALHGAVGRRRVLACPKNNEEMAGVL